MTAPTLLARAQALLARRSIQAAALAIVPLALATPAAHAQVVLTRIEAGFIDVSGSRFVFGSSSNSAGGFNAPGVFNFTSTVGAGGFTLGGNVLFDGAQNTLGSGEDLNIGPFRRYLTLTGTWDNQTVNQPLLFTFNGTSTFAGTVDLLFLSYTDQGGFGNNAQPASALVSGASYGITLDGSASYLTGQRGEFTIGFEYAWTPVPVGATTLLDTAFTLDAAISPIPEPSTYAALLGLAALAGAAALRRRRATA